MALHGRALTGLPITQAPPCRDSSRLSPWLEGSRAGEQTSEAHRLGSDARRACVEHRRLPARADAGRGASGRGGAGRAGGRAALGAARLEDPRGVALIAGIVMTTRARQSRVRVDSWRRVRRSHRVGPALRAPAWASRSPSSLSRSGSSPPAPMLVAEPAADASPMERRDVRKSSGTLILAAGGIVWIRNFVMTTRAR